MSECTANNDRFRSRILCKKSAVIAVSVVVIVLICIARSMPEYDIDQVDPRLRVLQQPYQSVNAKYYLDGGTIRIFIVDRDGHSEVFTFPCDNTKSTNDYERLFVGQIWLGPKKASDEVAEPEHTKRMLICILRDWPRRTAWEDDCLMRLRRHPVDFARHLVHRWRDDYHYP